MPEANIVNIMSIMISKVYASQVIMALYSNGFIEKVTHMIESWQDLESYTQYVYSTLLNPRDNGVEVSRNVILKGLKGEYQIDVFYQFVNAGVMHRVAIECKYHKRPLDRDAILQ